MEAPIKCQVCPFFEPVLRNGKYIYECSCWYSVCQLRDDEGLRKEVYETIKSLKGDNLCGESVPVYSIHDAPKICGTCKDAVMWAKEKIKQGEK